MLLLQYLFVLFHAIASISSFRIKSCNSNKINEIRKSSNTKSVVKFDTPQNISLHTPNSNVKIWCETDVLIDKCSLVHSSDLVICEKEIPLSCEQGDTCENNKHIKINSNFKRRCEFLFNQLFATGKNTEIKSNNRLYFQILLPPFNF